MEVITKLLTALLVNDISEFEVLVERDKNMGYL